MSILHNKSNVKRDIRLNQWKMLLRGLPMKN